VTTDNLVTMRPTKAGLTEVIQILPIDTSMAEIGSYSGESAEIFLTSGKIKKIICVDPWIDGYDMTDLAAYQCSMHVVEATFDERMKKYSNVVKLKMSSEDASKTIDDHSLDFVYIDGNHFYEFVKKDIELWLPKIKKDGYIGGHDYWRKNNVVRAIHDTIGEPDKVFPYSSWIKKI
jgi:hypothetical protein